MPSLELLLSEYAESHQNPVNRHIHKVCVPLIEWSLLGILYALPRPLPEISWAHLFALAALAYYLQFKNWKAFVGSLVLMMPFWIYVSFHPPLILQTSIAVFVVAWIGQFYGHKVEGKKPSFFRDLFFLLVGPLWVIESTLNVLGFSLIKRAA